MGIYFVIAIRNIVQARRRSFFLSLAIGLVTMCLVLLTALSGGVRANMIRNATTLSAGHINVAGFYKASLSDVAPIVTEREKVRKIVAEKTPNLAYIVDRHRGWAKLITETGSLQAGLSGVDLSEDKYFLDVIQLAREDEYREGGRAEILGHPENLTKNGTAMLFAAQAKRLGVTVGDAVTVTVETFNGYTNTTEVVVVAVARDLGMMSGWTVFLDKKTVQDLYKLSDDTTGAIMVYLKDIDKAEETMGVLRDVLRDAGYRIMDHQSAPFWMKFETVAAEDWTGQKLDLTIWEDEVAFVKWIVTAIDSISFVLITILAIIIAVGIMNAMWIAVRERTREVGTLRAVGMQRRRVLLMFLLEALLLGLAATVMGALAGTGIVALVDAAALTIPIDAVRLILLSNTLHLAITPGEVSRAVIAFTILTGLAALWPALRAARMQPVTAIQHVD